MNVILFQLSGDKFIDSQPASTYSWSDSAIYFIYMELGLIIITYKFHQVFCTK